MIVVVTSIPLLGGRKPEDGALRLTRMLLRWQAQVLSLCACAGVVLCICYNVKFAQKNGRTVQFVAGSASQVAKYGFETSPVLGPALSSCQLVLGTIAAPSLQGITARRRTAAAAGGDVQTRRRSAVALAIAGGEPDADGAGGGANEEPEVRVGDVRYIGMKDEEAADSYPDASDEVVSVVEGPHIAEVSRCWKRCRVELVITRNTRRSTFRRCQGAAKFEQNC